MPGRNCTAVIADNLMDKEDLGLGPHLSASSTSVIPVGTLRGGAKLYGEPFLYGGKVNTWYVFIQAEFMISRRLFLSFSGYCSFWEVIIQSIHVLPCANSFADILYLSVALVLDTSIESITREKTQSP